MVRGTRTEKALCRNIAKTSPSPNATKNRTRPAPTDQQRTSDRTSIEVKKAQRDPKWTRSETNTTAAIVAVTTTIDQRATKSRPSTPIDRCATNRETRTNSHARPNGTEKRKS